MGLSRVRASFLTSAGLAIGLHSLLAIWLSGYISWQIPVSGEQAVLQADMVSEQQLQLWVERAARLARQQQREEAEVQRRAEQARQRRIVAQQAVAAQQAQAAAQRRAAARQLAEQKKRQAKAAAKQRAEAAARQRAEEAQRQAEAAAQRVAEQARQRAEEEARQRAEAARQRETAERERALQAQYAAVQQRAEVVRISQLIQQKVARYWLRPPGMTGLTCRVQVRLGSTGSVLSVVISESSGQHIFDQSVEAAVWKADPLPMPKSETLRAAPRFREHIFIFDPMQHL